MMRPLRLRPNRILPGPRRHGMILIVVIWLIVMLTFIAYALAYDMRIGIRMTSESKKSLQALGLARTGMAKCIMDLRNDRFMAFFSPAHQSDTLENIWAQTDDKTRIEPEGRDAEGYWTARVVDNNRKLDVNALNQDNFESFAYLLMEVGKVDKDDAEEIALCVVDYIDGDTDTLAMEGGDESEVFTEMAQTMTREKLPDDWRFHARNDFMLNIEELLEIPGIDRDILYGDPEQTSRDPIERLDDDKPSEALADYVYAGRLGGVNINTASETVIAAMLYGAAHGQQDVDSMAAEVVDLRKSALKVKDNGPPGIRNISELSVAGVNPAIVGSLQNQFHVKFQSDEFDIIARGEFKGYRRTIAATARVSLETFNIDPDNDDTLGKRDASADGEPSQDTNLRVDPAVRLIRTWEY